MSQWFILFRSFDFKFSVREWVSAASDASNLSYASDVSDASIMTPDQPLTPSPASQLPAWLSSWTGIEGGKSQRYAHVRNINHLLKLVEGEVSRISLLKNHKRLQRRLLNRRINAGLKNIFWLPCIGIFLCTWKQTFFFFCRFLSIAVSTNSWQIQFVSQSLAGSICQQLFQSSQGDWNKNVSSWPAISRI